MSALDEVRAEMVRARAKHGNQHHLPLGTGDEVWTRAAEAAKTHCAASSARGELTWHAIAFEEVCETFAESEPAKVREEAIQAAAMFVAIVEKIDHDALMANPVALEQRIFHEDFGWGTITDVIVRAPLNDNVALVRWDSGVGVRWQNNRMGVAYDLAWVGAQHRESPDAGS